MEACAGVWKRACPRRRGCGASVWYRFGQPRPACLIVALLPRRQTRQCEICDLVSKAYLRLLWGKASGSVGLKPSETRVWQHTRLPRVWWNSGNPRSLCGTRKHDAYQHLAFIICKDFDRTLKVLLPSASAFLARDFRLSRKCQFVTLFHPALFANTFQQLICSKVRKGGIPASSPPTKQLLCDCG